MDMWNNYTGIEMAAKNCNCKAACLTALVLNDLYYYTL